MEEEEGKMREKMMRNHFVLFIDKGQTQDTGVENLLIFGKFCW